MKKPTNEPLKHRIVKITGNKTNKITYFIERKKVFLFLWTYWKVVYQNRKLVQFNTLAECQNWLDYKTESVTSVYTYY